MMGRGTKFNSIVLALLMALVVASCGGEDTADTSAPTSEAPSSTAAAPTTTAGSETPSDSSTPDTTGSAAQPERTSIKLAFQTPDFTQIANFRFVENMAEDGIEVEFVAFEDVGTLMRALVAEEVDMAITSAIASVIRLAEETGERIKILAADIQAADYVLVAQTDLTGLEDFVGTDRTVGISTPGDISDTLTRYVFQQAGFDPEQVNFVQIGGTSARMTAILNDQLDAGPAHAAEGLTAANEGGKQILIRYGEIIPNYQQHGLLASDDTIADNPVLLQLMVDNFIDSVRWAADNKDEYIQQAESELEESFAPEVMDEAYEIFQSIGLFAVNGGMETDLLNATVEVEQAVGSIEGEVPPIEDWTDGSFVADYLERNGTR